MFRRKFREKGLFKILSWILHFQVILHTAAGAVTFEDCGKDDIDKWYINQFQRNSVTRFLLQVYFINQLFAVSNFLTIREDIRYSRCTSLPVITMEMF
jgi:hypothetical protein